MTNTPLDLDALEARAKREIEIVESGMENRLLPQDADCPKYILILLTRLRSAEDALEKCHIGFSDIAMGDTSKQMRVIADGGCKIVRAHFERWEKK